MISIFMFLLFLRSCTYNVFLFELVIVLDMCIDNEHTCIIFFITYNFFLKCSIKEGLIEVNGIQNNGQKLKNKRKKKKKKKEKEHNGVPKYKE